MLPEMPTNSAPQQSGEMKAPSKIKDLVGAWEGRSKKSDEAPFAKAHTFGYSPVQEKKAVRTRSDKSSTSKPTRKKSTKQSMEELGAIASPRQIKKKFVVPKKKIIDNFVTSEPAQSSKASATMKQKVNEAPKEPEPKSALVVPPPIDLAPETPTTSTSKKTIDVPKVGSIRDRMKAFEGNQDVGGAPWLSQLHRGKRGSLYDTFSPMKSPQSVVSSRQKNKLVADLPTVDLMEESEEAKPNKDMETSAPSDTKDQEKSEESVEAQRQEEEDDGRIDRDTLVKNEIDKMIRDVEDYEIEDDMDEEVKECLRKAAIQSPAYTKKWYDAIGDSWIHCPSLATIIMDFSLIELAEEIYEEELPMLYTVSLRAVAAEVLQGEVELPEYVYRLAS